MDQTLTDYQTHIDECIRFKAVGKYAAALTALDAAILVCPIAEAIPELERVRKELAPKARPLPAWKRVLGWQE